MINFSKDPHRRLNILTNEWVLVSPHRTNRPWQGKEEEIKKRDTNKHDPNCYLCPGNTRSGGAKNPDYAHTFSFTNDFAALNDQGSISNYEEGLLKAKGEKGICKVLCFSPDHSKTMPDLEVEEIVKVIEMWQKEYAELGQYEYINHVQIFENKGTIMGCSNLHPHGQIWAQSSIPKEALKKSIQQLDYWQTKKENLLQDYIKQEIELDKRVIIRNEHFVALVPFWAIWPYETMIVPLRTIAHINDFTKEEKTSFAEILKHLTQALDKVFNTSFPYSSGIHQAPTDNLDHPEWCMHMSFYPPLLRSASVKKFMVGYEMFGEPQRDITPEMAADQLKSLV